MFTAPNQNQLFHVLFCSILSNDKQNSRLLKAASRNSNYLTLPELNFQTRSIKGEKLNLFQIQITTFPDYWSQISNVKDRVNSHLSELVLCRCLNFRLETSGCQESWPLWCSFCICCLSLSHHNRSSNVYLNEQSLTYLSLGFSSRFDGEKKDK